MNDDINLSAFGEGMDWALNAVVGDNHVGRPFYAYLFGFEQAVSVLADAARASVGTIDAPLPRNAVSVDTIIYPLLFCARHHIELFLKLSIDDVLDYTGSSEKHPNEHDLISLFGKLESICLQGAVALVRACKSLEPYVAEMNRTDESGQTFRYHKSSEQKPHLEQIPIINIDRFEQWFDQWRDTARIFEAQLNYLYETKDLGGSTSHFSREEIRSLAKQLPLRSEWNKAVLTEIRGVLEKEKETKITNREFTRAIEIIKSTPWLSILIGDEQPLPDLAQDVFSRIESKKNGAVSNIEWAALYCVARIGRGIEPPEYYETTMRRVREGHNHELTTAGPKIKSDLKLRPNVFLQGFSKLGQNTLRDALTARLSNST